MARTNWDVKRAFFRREALTSANGNLVSTGEVLLSYGWWEVARWEKTADGGWRIVRRNGPSYSVTTAGKHRTGIVQGDYFAGPGVEVVESPVYTPAHQGPMNTATWQANASNYAPRGLATNGHGRFSTSTSKYGG